MEGVLNECCQKAMYFFGISQESERFYASLSAKAFGSKLEKGRIQINDVIINIMATISPILDSGFGRNDWRGDGAVVWNVYSTTTGEGIPRNAGRDVAFLR